MVLANLSTLQALLSIHNSKKVIAPPPTVATTSTAVVAAGASGAGTTAPEHIKERSYPLFQVVSSLSAPEVVISPSFNDINRIISKIQKIIVESTQPFVRWMNGTCVETPPQMVGEDEEPVCLCVVYCTLLALIFFSLRLFSLSTMTFLRILKLLRPC